MPSMQARSVQIPSPLPKIHSNAILSRKNPTCKVGLLGKGTLKVLKCLSKRTNFQLQSTAFHASRHIILIYIDTFKNTLEASFLRTWRPVLWQLIPTNQEKKPTHILRDQKVNLIQLPHLSWHSTRWNAWGIQGVLKILIDQFQYIRILAWVRGLGKYNKRN